MKFILIQKINFRGIAYVKVDHSGFEHVSLSDVKKILISSLQHFISKLFTLTSFWRDIFVIIDRKMRANMRFHMTHEFVLLAKTILSMYYAGRKPCQTTKCHFFTDNIIILYSHLFVFILILLVKIYLY